MLLVMMLGACGSKENRRDGFYANGLKFEEAGRFSEARVEGRNVIKLDPNHVGAHLLLARCALKEQNWREAFGNFQRAVELEPANTEALLGVGRLYLLSGDTNQAEAHAGQVLALDPQSVDGLLLRAGAMLRAKRFEEAGRQLDLVFAKDPANEDALLALSVIHSEQGRNSDALAVIGKGIGKKPDSRPLHFRAASLAADMEDYAAAEQHLLKLKELDPANRGVQILLAALYERMGQNGRVEGILRELLAAEPGSEEGRLRLMDYLMRTGKAEDALAVAQEGEPSPKLRLASAAVLLTVGRADEGEAALVALAGDKEAGPAGIEARLRMSEI